MSVDKGLWVAGKVSRFFDGKVLLGRTLLGQRSMVGVPIWTQRLEGAEEGKESLNFQITVSIAAVIAGILIFVFIGILLLPLIMIGSLVLVIIATVKANNGERYRYPFCLRLIK
jgi:uncharacterized Tic20 family protein